MIFQSTLRARRSDEGEENKLTTMSFISIHAPRKAERLKNSPFLYYCTLFQSTLRARRSDRCLRQLLHAHAHFNPRSAQGGATEAVYSKRTRERYFNPRSAQGGATFERPARKLDIVGFQSTLRARRSDDELRDFRSFLVHFNPRSAQGGATVRADYAHLLVSISIHAPRKAERRCRRLVSSFHTPFQSTLRARRSDRQWRIFVYIHKKISIHAPRKAERLLDLLVVILEPLFQSTLRARRSDKLLS